MAKKRYQDCKNGKDLIRVAEKRGGVVLRQTGSHAILTNQDKRGRVVIPNHNGDMSKGTWNAVVKMLRLVLPIFIAGWIALVFSYKGGMP